MTNDIPLTLADVWENVECRQNDPELWWSEGLEKQGAQYTDEKIAQVKMALTICNRCPLALQCLEMGLTEEDKHWGIWGGYLPGERQAMLGETKMHHNRKAIQKAIYLRAVTGVPTP